MNLRKFISTVGVPTISKKLKISKQSVYKWRDGQTPSVENAKKLVKLSGGHLTLDSILNN